MRSPSDKLRGSLPVQVRSRETPESLVVQPSCVAEMPGAEQGGATGRSAACAKPAQASSNATTFGWSRGSRADSATVKAMEDIWGSGAGVEGPSGVRGVERSDGCPGNWGGPPRPRRCGRREACRPITSDPGKWPAAERESEGVVVVTIGETTQLVGSEGPLLHRCIDGEGRDPGECRHVG